ncbi:MAG: amidophosphoribosyltransferase [Candidatus Amulumruptor caecigallinarius]|uniref:Amidophosphoribosyltransferase n=1 Tax=Candidatus Amulumruptor caecigallinarius TaxID=2109911 RepID=A0A4V1LAJ9_9BACT|nr:MAG: amidophosphoribosyltransferase [Candidatus Amulumruptor caecigallinarius]HJE39561.1 amidophosphoribosyltransferase [Candidatus Amulumruptor caecigallinarius]
MEQLKHECGIAMIRLLKPVEYYRRKYGTSAYALNKLYLLMEKQHNRGQEGAGVGVVKLDARPGSEYLFRERALGAAAIQEIFSTINHKLDGTDDAPFIGNIYMGHLRYSTTGRSGISYVHPFLRRNNWRSRNLMLCGNFNMTNVEQLFQSIVGRGQHPRIYSDTIVLLEQLGYALDRENHRLYTAYRDTLAEPQLSLRIEDELNMENMLRSEAPAWDGGFVICGATGSGDMFVLRDSHGIRPAFYYADDEVVVVASERPVIQTVFNIPRRAVQELTPGSALTVNKAGEMRVTDILGEKANARCSFERIYFSRGSDADIYQERKSLGRNLVPEILRHVDGDLDHTVFSFIPNTAEVAFIGMTEGLEAELDRRKEAAILGASQAGALTHEALRAIMSHKLRIEKIAIKDIKLRTFIAEGESRNDLAAHVYDVSYGCVTNGVDNLVVIDDSIVRGTTLRQSIINMLDRLHPRKIVVVSSSPQVRYPDYYGIDMSRMGEFAAFRAAVALLKERGMEYVLTQTYEQCLAQASRPDEEIRNCVKNVYAPFTPQEISDKIAEMLTPDGTNAEVSLVYQSMDGLHEAIPGHPGDWYFSGDYPTPGGTRLVNRAFVNFYEGNADKR